MSLDAESKWTRKLTDTEEFFYRTHEKKFMIIRYNLKLCTKMSLQERDVRTALAHLYRKVPTLRLCIRPRNKELWFYSRDDESIDFHTGEASAYEREHRDILTHHYNTSDGPLWCARLFPAPPHCPCPMPELLMEYPHQYNLLFGFHHSITDGTSNVKICDWFFSILNDIISGKAIDDKEQLGYHLPTEEMEVMLVRIKLELTNNVEELNILRDYYKAIVSIDQKLLTVYPSERPNVPSTETILHELTSLETTKLLQKCKSEGITVNSVITTAISIAVVEILQQAGVNEPLYEIPHSQLVNLRRYLKDYSGNSLGTNLGPMLVNMNIRLGDADKFWDIARDYDQKIKHLLQEKRPLKAEVKNQLIKGTAERDKFFTDDIRDFHNHYFTVSNLGNLKFKGEGEHVQVTHLIRTSAIQKIISTHCMHTFRGRLHYTLDYGAEYLSHEGALLWCDTIFRILKTVI